MREGLAAHPLKAASWAPLAADLGHEGWTAGLKAQGFRPDVATVWLAEGLLMYLQPAAVDAMLREMAGACAHEAVHVRSTNRIKHHEPTMERMRIRTSNTTFC